MWGGWGEVVRSHPADPAAVTVMRGPGTSDMRGLKGERPGGCKVATGV